VTEWHRSQSHSLPGIQASNDCESDCLVSFSAQCPTCLGANVSMAPLHAKEAASRPVVAGKPLAMLPCFALRLFIDCSALIDMTVVSHT